jgi:hypothetical protein
MSKFQVFDRHGRRVERDGVLEDGDRLRVPVFMRDALSPLQRAVAEDGERRRDRARVHDGTGDSRFVGHKPGPVYSADAHAYDAKEQARREAINDAKNAWRDSPTGFGSKEFVGAREGDVCTVAGPEYPEDFGSPGHLRRRGNKLVCVPDKPRSRDAMPTGPVYDAAAGARIKQEAYDAMCFDMANAWRKP